MSRSEGEEGSVGEDGRSRRPSRRYQVVRSAPSALVREEDDGDEEEGGRMSRNRNRECYCNKILRIRSIHYTDLVIEKFMVAAPIVL